MKQFNGLPVKIQLRMLEAQVEQGNEANSAVFEEKLNANAGLGGFDWYRTKEGTDSWSRAIFEDNYTLLYKYNPSLRPDNEEPCHSPE